MTTTYKLSQKPDDKTTYRIPILGAVEKFCGQENRDGFIRNILLEEKMPSFENKNQFAI